MSGHTRPARGTPVALLGVALLVLASCDASRSASGERFAVVVSMSIIADLASAVAGGDAEITTLVPIGGDPHVYEPTPSDARALQDADLVVMNGAGLEPWLPSLLPGDVELVDLMARVDLPLVSDEDGEPDPHLWMVPTNAIRYVEAMAEAFAEADPDRAAAYQRRAAEYAEELRDLDDELRAALDVIPPSNRKLVTSHDAYSYFADHYGIEVLGSVVGISTEEEPSAGVVARLIDEVRRTQVPTIFVESTVDPRVVERIAAEAGVEVGEPLYGDSVGEPGSGAETYQDMLRANVESLVNGLAR